MKSAYVILVDPSHLSNTSEFHNYISKKLYPKYISNWWHYLEGPTYIVVSELNEKQLSKLLDPALPNKRFLVMKVNTKATQGKLPPDGWKWLGKHPN